MQFVIKFDFIKNVRKIYFTILISLSSFGQNCPSLKGELRNCQLARNANIMIEMIWNKFNIKPQKITETRNFQNKIIAYSNQSDHFKVNEGLKIRTDIGELILAPIKCNSGYVQTKTSSIVKPLSFEVQAEISISATMNQYNFYIRNTYADFHVYCQRK